MIFKYLSPRRWVQLITLVAANAYVFDFFKNTPCGILNCSRCAFSTVKCPLIAFQAGAVAFGMFGGLMQKTVGAIMLASGSLVLFASTLGTWSCAWLCPFGTVQDYLYKIPTPKFNLPAWMGWGRVPLFIGVGVLASYATGTLFFCSVCPTGTVTRLAQDAVGIPQFLKAPEGMLAVAGLAVTVAFLVLAVFTSRPFCHLMCPIGGVYGIFNKISGLKRSVKEGECVSCFKCKRACPQGLDPVAALDSQACNRCLECHKTCKALVMDVRL